ncbi:Homeodomain-like protein [Aspergillus ambiguus]|uniref:Homeodomain-like protein n=1 Tax=Aspergillus ambiguus TaxID=176160 RepID=UPI003CCDE949
MEPGPETGVSLLFSSDPNQLDIEIPLIIPALQMEPLKIRRPEGGDILFFMCRSILPVLAHHTSTRDAPNSSQMDDRRRRFAISRVVGGKVKDWTVIADKISGRTNKDCRKRWHNVLSGGFNKGYWTKEEDKLLTRAVQTYGETWTAVADTVKTRSADQCAKRWKQCLDPQLDRSEWTEEDNRRLLEVAAMKGRRWKDIQLEHFPSRSRNAIKNQYVAFQCKKSDRTNVSWTPQDSPLSPDESTS